MGFHLEQHVLPVASSRPLSFCSFFTSTQHNHTSNHSYDKLWIWILSNVLLSVRPIKEGGNLINQLLKEWFKMKMHVIHYLLAPHADGKLGAVSLSTHHS